MNATNTRVKPSFCRCARVEVACADRCARQGYCICRPDHIRVGGTCCVLRDPRSEVERFFIADVLTLFNGQPFPKWEWKKAFLAPKTRRPVSDSLLTTRGQLIKFVKPEARP
jgi:hypothetical protein